MWVHNFSGFCLWMRKPTQELLCSIYLFFILLQFSLIWLTASAEKLMGVAENLLNSICNFSEVIWKVSKIVLGRRDSFRFVLPKFRI